eukprot:GHVO01023170.1.p1 GENE.GHVO01023170.1~~GHVO01023170.1.p1  ORF type:complete len:266 (-),score=34.34 GHVO01023170.1:89-886(-)
MVYPYYWFPEFRFGKDFGSAYSGLFSHYHKHKILYTRIWAVARSYGHHSKQWMASLPDITTKGDDLEIPPNIRWFIKRQPPVADNDFQCWTLTRLLRRVHALFYEQIDATPDVLPDIADIMSRERLKVLAGVAIQTTSFLSDTLQSFGNCDLGRLAETFGASLVHGRMASLEPSTTHLVTRTGAHTEKTKEGAEKKIHVVHSHWLEAAIYTFKRPREGIFDPQSSDTYRDFWDILTDKDGGRDGFEDMATAELEDLEDELIASFM